MPVMTRDEAQALIERVVKMSRADEIQVSLGAGVENNIRFADNRITTAGGVNDLDVRVFSAFGRRHAVATTNDVTDEGLQRAVRQSEALARLAPENPEKMPLVGPQTYKEVDGHFGSTAGATAADRAQAAGVTLSAAASAGGLKAAGILLVNDRVNALGNSAGLFAYRPSTSVDFTTTVRTNDGTGSGWGGANHPDWTKVNFQAASDTAIAKARLSRNPVRIEPGRYTVVLEPQAAADLVSLVANAFSARSAMEGRSAFSKPGGGTKVGEQIMDQRVSFISDASHPLILGSPYDNDGRPVQPRTWIENGVLRNLDYSPFWAQKNGVPVIGTSGSLIMTGGTQSLADIIASTERGVLVTRFWYIRPVNSRTLLYTGLTRDGTFLIEDGRIARPVQNMRFNESPLFMLGKLDAVGAPVRVSNSEAMPALRVRDFNFASVSDAV
ncbi:MAG: TldD/PmbA family protein [Gemmatimonadaceae bacterium]